MHNHVVFKNKEDLIKARIRSEDVVLDVGFWGQGVTAASSRWPHRLLRAQARDVYGLDLEFDEAVLPEGIVHDHYFKESAETFSVPVRPTVIFAGDLIEHLSNPGLFLESCKRNLAFSGRLIITTPNVFNFFDMIQKIVRFEPTVNKDHTSYFNIKTLTQLLGKNGWRVEESGFVYSLQYVYRESLKKHFLNVVYRVLAFFTPKYIETFFIVAVPDESTRGEHT